MDNTRRIGEEATTGTDNNRLEMEDIVVLNSQQSSSSSSPLPPTSMATTTTSGLLSASSKSANKSRRRRRRRHDQNREEDDVDLGVNYEDDDDDDDNDDDDDDDISSTVTPSGGDSDNNSDLYLKYLRFTNTSVQQGYNSPTTLNLLSPAISPAFNLSTSSTAAAAAVGTTAATMTVMAPPPPPPPPHITSSTQPPPSQSTSHHRHSHQLQQQHRSTLRPTSSSDSISSNDFLQLQQQQRNARRAHQSDHLAKELNATFNIDTLVSGLMADEPSDNSNATAAAAVGTSSASDSVSHPHFFEFIHKALESFSQKTANSSSQSVAEFNQKATPLIEYLRDMTSKQSANYDLGKRVEETEKYLKTLTLASINANESTTKRKKLRTVKERDQIKTTSTTTTTTTTTPTKGGKSTDRNALSDNTTKPAKTKVDEKLKSKSNDQIVGSSSPTTLAAPPTTTTTTIPSGDYILCNMATKKCTLVTEKDVIIEEMKREREVLKIHLHYLSNQIQRLKWKLNNKHQDKKILHRDDYEELIEQLRTLQKVNKDLENSLSIQREYYENRLKTYQIRLNKTKLQIALQEGKIPIDI